MLKSIRLLLMDEGLCAAMAAKARELVVNRFASEKRNGRAQSRGKQCGRREGLND